MNASSRCLIALLGCVSVELAVTASSAAAQVGAYAPCIPIAASPSAHVSAGRATNTSGTIRAKGSNQVLTGSSVTLAQRSKDYFEIRTSCPLPPNCTHRSDYPRTRFESGAPGGVRVFPLDLECNISVPGQSTRTYDMHVPVNYTNKVNVPLVMEMHGGGGWNPRPFTQEGSGWQYISDTDADTFIMLYPIGSATAPNTTNKIGEEWQTCNYDNPQIQCPSPGYPHDRNFLIEMTKHAVNGMKINKRRIYAVGLSSGAAMVHSLNCKYSEYFAAVAPMSGGVAAPSQARARDRWDMTQNCSPTRKVPQFYVHSFHDTEVPFSEGVSSVNYWRNKVGGCGSSDSSTMPQANWDPWDSSDVPGQDVSIVRTRTCALGTQMAFTQIDGSLSNSGFGGGHVAFFGDDFYWPGTAEGQPLLARWAWDWMKRFSLPADPAWPPALQ